MPDPVWNVTYHMTAYCTIIEPNRETVWPTRNRDVLRFQCAGAAVVSLM